MISYKIYLDGKYQKTVSELTAILDGLKPNTEYSVQVSATDGTDESALSTAVKFNTSTVPATGITLNVTTKQMVKGTTFQLTGTIAPANATDKTITWISSDSTTAKVSTTGLVTALKTGTVKITAKTVNGLTADCTLTITTNLKAPTDLTVSAVSATSATLTWKEG